MIEIKPQVSPSSLQKRLLKLKNGRTPNLKMTKKRAKNGMTEKLPQLKKKL